MAKKPKKTQSPNTQRSDEEIAEALRSSGGIVSVASKKLNLTRQAVYQRLKDSEVLRQAQEDGQESGDDLAEKTVLEVMQRARQPKDRLAAARTWLSRAKSKRGFNVHKVGVGGIGKDGDVLPGEFTVSFSA